MNKEQEIKRNMELLKISRQEAEELYISDHEDIVTPEMAEMERKAKAIKRYEKSDKARKKSSKERKVDTEKKKLLDYLERGLHDNIITGGYAITNIKNEAEFSFLHNGTAYTVKLIKHRPPK